MSQTIAMRRATPADAETILHQRREMFLEIGLSTAEQLDSAAPGFITWVRERLANETYLGWFALDENSEPVAGAGLWLIDWPPGPLDPRGGRAYLLNVYTEPQHRGRGLAHRLVETTIAWARANGYRVVSLHASEAGRPIYEQIGFITTNEMTLHLSPASEGHDP